MIQKIIVIAFIIGFSQCVIGFGEITTRTENNYNSQLKTITVSGMVCHACSVKLENAFMNIEGVKANADFKTQTIQLTLDKKKYLTHDEIRSVVQKEGYTVLDVQ